MPPLHNTDSNGREAASSRLVYSPPSAGIARRTRRRIARRILPFVFTLYIVAYLDRANVAFANVPMSADLGFSEQVFGFGAGVFFLGYFLLEIPGALIVERWSARKWLARILITWGIFTIGVGMVRTAAQFYAARFLLGAAEAGFFPGILVYLTHWFRSGDRARAMAGFVIAAPVALATGAPLSALILKLHAFGVPGWRWVFLLEGMPAIAFGIVTLFYLTDHPQDAQWLDPEGRAWIAAELATERLRKPEAASKRWWRALGERNVLVLTAAYFCANVAGYGFIFWLPRTLTKVLGLHSAAAAAVAALPFAAAGIAALAISRFSDRSGERKAYACGAFLAAGTFLALGSIPGQPLAVVLATVTLTGAAVYAWIAPFWVLPTLTLKEDAAAASIGFINSVGNLGGFLGPFLIGYLLSRGWAPGTVMLVPAAAYFASAALTGLHRATPTHELV
jgi:MFS transporter, ACS family, tartrate transporter